MTLRGTDPLSYITEYTLVYDHYLERLGDVGVARAELRVLLWGLGFWFGAKGLNIRVEGMGFGVLGLGFGVLGLGFGVLGFGFGVKDLNIRV